MYSKLASFPGPAQLFVACSTEKRGELGIFSHRTNSDGKLGGAWERGYSKQQYPYYIQDLHMILAYAYCLPFSELCK